MLSLSQSKIKVERRNSKVILKTLTIRIRVSEPLCMFDRLFDFVLVLQRIPAWNSCHLPSTSVFFIICQIFPEWGSRNSWVLLTRFLRNLYTYILSYVLGSLSSLTCRILNFENFFCFFSTVSACRNHQQIFVIQNSNRHVQIDDLLTKITYF